jgi:hypothetical protein
MTTVGSKISKGFGITKQWMKQKLSISQPSEENAELVAMLEKLKKTHCDLKDILKRAKSLHKYNAAAADSRQHFVLSLSGVVNDQKDEQLVAQTGALIKDETSRERITRHTNDALQQQMIAPLEQLLKEEIEQALHLRVNYKLAHLDYDAHVREVDASKDKHVDKREQAEKELKQAVNAYEESKLQLAAKCREIDQKVMKIFSDNVRLYNTSFEEGAKVVHEGFVEVQPSTV